MLLKYRQSVSQMLVATAMIVLPASAALADGDSSADASGGYTNYVSESTAAIIKVPINAQGQELVRAAELRTYSGEAVTSDNTAAIRRAFEEGATVSAVPTISADDVNSDSSTWGWFNWCGNYGYRSNYYYNYYPSYYSYGNYYNYSQPYYNNYYNSGYNNGYGDNYGGGNYYGYRYYYYPRY